MSTTTIHFNYEPIAFTRLALRMYADKLLKKQIGAGDVYACYDYLDQATDQEIEQVLDTYTERFGVSVITFKDWKTECKNIWTCIQETSRFKDAAFYWRIRQLTQNGACAVADKLTRIVHVCNYGEHMETALAALKHDHPDVFGLYERALFAPVDRFFANNFILIGGHDALSLRLPADS